MALIPAVEDDACIWNRTNTVCPRLGSVRYIVLHERRHIRDLVQCAMHSHAHTSMLADRGVLAAELKIMLCAAQVEVQIGRPVLDADRSGFAPIRFLHVSRG